MLFSDDPAACIFHCPIIPCSEVFNSVVARDFHKTFAHSQNYCTFCSQSFRFYGQWRAHEAKHIMLEVGSQYDPHHILWKCGICGIFGVSEYRRNTHIINHWQEGCTMEDWEGAPVIKLLGFAETCDLMFVSQNELQVAAAEAMRPGYSGRPLRFSTTPMKDSHMVQPPPKEVEQPVDTMTKEHKSSPLVRPRAVPEPARSTVHGLFSSIRNKFRRPKKKTPKPPEMQGHRIRPEEIFGPGDARSQR
jgi:hypothetical protein